MIQKISVLTCLLMMILGQALAQINQPITISNDIQLIHIKDSIWMHTSWYQTQNFGRVSANGLIIIKNKQAIMIDTPWNDEMTKQLTQFVEDSLKVQFVKLIIGHAHDDCMGGLNYLQRRGIESIANSMTVAQCREHQLPIPSTPFSDSLTFDFNGLQIECRYFGGGHTSDNITVWIPKERTLFGGCLIKSADAMNLGNTAEAILDDWDSTVKKVMKAYPNLEVVVPGHGNYGNSSLLTHTIQLVEQHK